MQGLSEVVVVRGRCNEVCVLRARLSGRRGVARSRCHGVRLEVMNC